MNTILPPVSMPAIAPALVVLFQNNENSIIGPKVAPKPAHANDTTLKITLFSSNAMIIPNNETSSNVIRETIITCLSVASYFNTINLN